MASYQVYWRRTLAHPRTDYDRGVIEYGNSSAIGNTEREAVEWALKGPSNGGEWNVVVEKVVPL